MTLPIGPEGDRFLGVFGEMSGEVAKPRVSVVLNWITELLDRLPAER